jgi:hypothetical protein
LPKNETIIESDATPPDQGSGPDGCSAYRIGLVLTALQKKLSQAETEVERAGILAEIESLEEEMGF